MPTTALYEVTVHPSSSRLQVALEVRNRLDRGQRNKEIAETLGISPSAVSKLARVASYAGKPLPNESQLHCELRRHFGARVAGLASWVPTNVQSLEELRCHLRERSRRACQRDLMRVPRLGKASVQTILAWAFEQE